MKSLLDHPKFSFEEDEGAVDDTVFLAAEAGHMESLRVLLEGVA